MKDEIKKILDKFDKVLENYELDKKWGQMSVDSICHLFPSEMIAIKDHIINLEEELKSANESITWWNNRYKALQNRNIELVLERDRLEENNKSMQVEMARVWEKLDKVKEYINTHYLNANEPYLLNIVNGEDKDVKD